MPDPLSLVLKSSLILLAALALAFTFRRAPAARRHALWATALGGVLALPLLSPALPSLSLPVLPASAGAKARPPSPRLAGGIPEAASPAGSAGKPLREPGARHGELPLSPNDGGRAGSSVTGGGAGRPSPSRALLAVWAAGLAGLLLRLAAGGWQMRRLVREARPMFRGRAPELAGELSRELGLTRPVRLLLSPRTGSPVTWGWLRPVVLLPRSILSWPEGRLRVVLLHELIHVRRRHWPLQILAALAVALHWFNPLVWLAGRRLEMEREMACDEGVVAQGTLPSDYATHLLEIARSLPGARRTPAAGLAVSLSFSRHLRSSRSRRSPLERRLVMILKPRNRSGPARWPALALAGMAAAILPVAAFQLRAASPAPPEPAAGDVRAAAATAPPPVTEVAERAEEGGGTVFTMSHGHGDFVLRKSIDGVDLRVHIEDPETVELAPDGREILAMGHHAEVVIRTEHQGSRQRLEISRGGGGLEYEWSVNGEPRAMDADAREWMHLTLQIAGNLREASHLRGRHSSLKGRISSIRGHVSSRKGEISSIRGRRSSLKGEISSIRGHVSSLKGRISSIRGHESSLRGRISSLRGRISSLEAGKGHAPSGASKERRLLVEALNEDIDREIASVREEIREVEAELEAYGGDRRVREVEQEILEYGAEARIAEVERELAALDVEGRVREIEREIREYDPEGRIREVEERIEALQPLEKADEIMERTEALNPRLKETIRRLR